MMIQDLTKRQLAEYKKIAKLNNQGNHCQFVVEFNKFKKKHGLR